MNAFTFKSSKNVRLCFPHSLLTSSHAHFRSTEMVDIVDIEMNVYFCIELHRVSQAAFWYHLGTSKLALSRSLVGKT